MTQSTRDDGFTLIELLIVVAIIGIIAGIAVPGLLRARMVSNETSAIGSLRTVATAQTAYSAVCGSSAYATSLPILGVAPAGVGEPFLGADMTGAVTVTKSGFLVTVNAGGFAAAGTDCNGTPTATGYYASAAPVGLGSTGNRAFALNADSAIYFNIGAVPPNPANTGTPVQ